MGQIKKTRRVTSRECPDGMMKEFTINKPNLSPWELNFTQDDGIVCHRSCGGVIVRRARKIPGRPRKQYSKSYLMFLAYTAHGRLFCVDCGDILGRRAWMTMRTRANLTASPLMINIENPPLYAGTRKLKLWCYCSPPRVEDDEAAPVAENEQPF